MAIFCNNDLLLIAKCNPRLGVNEYQRATRLAEKIVEMGVKVTLVTEWLPKRLEIQSNKLPFNVIQAKSNDEIDFLNYVERTSKKLQPTRIAVASEFPSHRSSIDSTWIDFSETAMAEGSPIRKIYIPSSQFKSKSKPRQTSKQVCRVLVTLNESDETRRLAVFEFLDQLDRRFSVDAFISGIGATHFERRKKPILHGKTRIHQRKDRIFELAKQSNIALTDSEIDAEQFLRLGLPHLKLYSELATDPNFLWKAAKRVESENRANGRSEVEIRLARYLVGQTFKFEPLNSETAPVVLQKFSDPESEVYDCHAPKRSNHLVQKKTADQGVATAKLQVWEILDSKKLPCGYVSRESLFPKEQSLKIVLAPRFRGRGIGTALIERVCDDWLQSDSSSNIYADVDHRNVAAKNSFRKAGFEAIDLMASGKQSVIRFELRNFVLSNASWKMPKAA